MASSLIVLQIAFIVFGVVRECNANPVDIPLSKSKKPTLLVEDTFSHIGKDDLAARLTGPVGHVLCRFAGPAPAADYVTSFAMDWACQPVRENVITKPQYVYKMEPFDKTLWNEFREQCGCRLISYTMPFLRFQASTSTWILDSQKVPVGTSCYELDAPQCKKVMEY